MKNASLALLTALALAACSDPAEGVAAATVGAPTAAPSPTTAPPTAPSTARETLAIDRASSSVGFTGAKVTASHDGSFTDFSGTIQLDPASVSASSVEVTVQVASLVIEPARLAQHLLTPDFFDAPRFPTATFRSTAIEAGSTAQIDGRPATHTVTGELTMRGTTRTITFPAILTVAEDAVTADSEFAIRRQDFGIVYTGMADDLIRDEVVIRFHMRAPRG